MDHRKLVQPEFMNEQGALFGGYLLKWVDEYAYMTVSLEHPGNRFVTIGMDQVEFKHPIALGEILRFTVTETRKGSSSVTLQVEVFGEREAASDETALFATNITFVNLDEQGKPAPLA